MEIPRWQFCMNEMRACDQQGVINAFTRGMRVEVR